MRFYKGRWDEDRGDEFSGRGASDWYFEVQADETVTRQMEVYDSGVVLQYDHQHLDAEFGGLTDKAFDPFGFPCIEIAREEFDAAWASHTVRNR